MSRIKTATMVELIERAEYHCEACGGPLGEFKVHHRYALRMGGSRLPWVHSAINLMLVHESCHNITEWSIHQNVERSKRLFHIIPMGETPFSVPAPIATREIFTLRA